MPSLNQEACFAIPAPDPGPDFTAAIFDNWQQSFIEICARLSGRCAEEYSWHLNNHVGSESPYVAKHALIDALKYCYYHLVHASSEDSQRAIVLKLDESIELCTSGFHIRANQVIQTIKPSNINAILYQIRNELVGQAALEYANDVHVYNRFFTVANQLNIGVLPLNADDPHVANVDTIPLSDDAIKERITSIFKEVYQPARLFCQITEHIRNRLQSELDYKGRLHVGYTYGQYDSFLKLLNHLFAANETLNAAEYLIMDNDNQIVDLNWPAIYIWLFNILYTHYMMFSDTEADCILNLLKGHECDVYPLITGGFIKDVVGLSQFICLLPLENVNSQFSLINAFLNKETPQEQALSLGVLFESLKHKAHFAHLLDNITHLNQYLQQLGRIDEDGTPLFLLLIQKNKHTRALLSLVASQPIAFFAPLLRAVNSNHYNALILSLISSPVAVESILDLIEKLDASLQLDILLQVGKEDNNNVLMIASDINNPYGLNRVINILKSIQPNMLNSFLKQQDVYGNNALMNAAYNSPASIPILLERIDLLDHKDQEIIFMQLGDVDRNVLLLIAHTNHPEIMRLVLAQLTKLNTNVLITLFKQTSMQGYNCFMTALMYSPNSIQAIIECFHLLPMDVQLELITLRGDQDEHALMMAIAYGHTVAAEYMFELIEQQPQLVRKNLLKQQDKDGSNCLMHAVWYSPNLIPMLLKSIDTLDSSDQIELFQHVNSQGDSTFFTAIINNNIDAVTFMLSVLITHNKAALADLLKQTFRDGYNCFMVALMHSPNSIQALIECFHMLPIDVQLALITLRGDQDEHALMMAITFGRTVAAEYMFELIEQQPQLVRKNLLKQQDKGGSNCLMHAVWYSPNLIPMLLKSINTLDSSDQIELFQHVNSQGDSTFFTAIINNNIDAVTFMLSVLITHNKAALADLLKQTSLFNNNPFIHALLSNQEMANVILKHILMLDALQQAVIFKHVKEDNSNALSIAATHNAQRFKELLTALKNDHLELLQYLLSLQNQQGDNCLLQVLRHAPGLVILLLETFDVFDVSVQLKLLTQENTQADCFMSLLFKQSYQMIQDDNSSLSNQAKVFVCILKLPFFKKHIQKHPLLLGNMMVDILVELEPSVDNSYILIIRRLAILMGLMKERDLIPILTLRSDTGVTVLDMIATKHSGLLRCLYKTLSQRTLEQVSQINDSHASEQQLHDQSNVTVSINAYLKRTGIFRSYSKEKVRPLFEPSMSMPYSSDHDTPAY